MGCAASTAAASQPSATATSGSKRKAALRERRATRDAKLQNFRAIPDQFQTLEQVTQEIRAAGLESSQLIIGVDFTKSNLWTGQNSFKGKSLHDCYTGEPNPYQQCLSIVGRTLESFDDDRLIPAYGFGDNWSRDRTVLPFKKGAGGVVKPCKGVEEVLERYQKIAKKIILAGPTSFAPLIYEAIRLVKEERQYHILVIIADGKVDARKEETVEAIVAASLHPISIIMIGVGDGPWDTMEEFDDELPERQFDNFQFVCFNEIKEAVGNDNGPRFESNFALAALMEIPDQYKAIKELNLLPHSAVGQQVAASASSAFLYDDEDEEEEEEEPDAFDAMDDGPVSSPTASGRFDTFMPPDVNEEPPDLYLCPITHELMRDPCVAGDGFTYERAAITAWIQGKKAPVSPMTGAPIANTFIPNHSLRSQIITWMEAH